MKWAYIILNQFYLISSPIESAMIFSTGDLAVGNFYEKEDNYNYYIKFEFNKIL